MAIRADLRLFFANSNLTQKQIEQYCKVSQGQVSRILSGENKRVSGAVLKICKYANINPFLTADYELTNDIDLIDAIRLAVGKDPAKARTITRVIQALVEH